MTDVSGVSSTDMSKAYDLTRVEREKIEAEIRDSEYEEAVPESPPAEAGRGENISTIV